LKTWRWGSRPDERVFAELSWEGACAELFMS
jgi:hypothetical protein